MNDFKSRNLGTLALVVGVAMMIGAPADAQRRSRGGSRGARTHQTPPATTVAPKQTTPDQRSMAEERTGRQAAGQQPQELKKVPPKSGGLAKGLIGGLVAGGLIGALMGGGRGSLAGGGLFMALMQVALIGGLIWFLLRMFRRRTHPAARGDATQTSFVRMEQRTAPMPTGSHGYSGAARTTPNDEIEIRDSDKQEFERLLVEVKDAFGREDYARLRELTTPEIMSYLAEEISQNAVNGHRNSVSGTQLIGAEVAEAWREGSTDYATIAMRHESIDLIVDRNSGAIIEGDAARPRQATELWTFVREANDPWRLSAIQHV
jgi:predicted lipid-binding transport protein (Tim44 family)